MANREQLPGWYEEDVVCVAVIPEGQLVDWSPGSYEPEESVWPPEGTFLRLQCIARELDLPRIGSLNIYEQSRLSQAECQALLEQWSDIETAVERTPGAGWVAAIGLILRRCATSARTQVLIEGPDGGGSNDMDDIRNIVILTGAGVSAESGLATFRGPDGLWEGHRVEDVCTPEAFRRDAALVQAFYDARRAKLKGVEPNEAHRAIARLDAQWPGELLIVTQNVDDLHERAGARRVLHMHGELKSAWCLACDARMKWEEDLGGHPPCPACGAAGRLRPDIVWFGEMPYEMERIDRALMEADLFVSIGTSGAVYPAAGFVQTARYAGARTLELNLEPSLGSFHFHESHIGRAGELVPAWVEEVLATA